jgi:predicted kinase
MTDWGPDRQARPRAGPRALTEPANRQVVLVTGPPAAGKTTIAGPLATELGFALLAKDRIKEALHDALGQQEGFGPGQAPDIGWSRRLGAAAMELIWTLAADAPAVVLEANFWPDMVDQARLRSLSAAPVEVHCQCPVEECMRRYGSRAGTRHPVHRGADEQRVGRALFERSARPLGFGPVVSVDTTSAVDIGWLADGVRRLLPAVGAPA